MIVEIVTIFVSDCGRKESREIGGEVAIIGRRGPSFLFPAGPFTTVRVLVPQARRGDLDDTVGEVQCLVFERNEMRCLL